ERYRGIYKAHVYRSTHRLTGVFRVPAHFGLAETNDVVGVEPAQIELGVTDSRGLRKPPQVVWQGLEVAVRTGTDLAWLEQGASAAVGPAYWPDERRIPFDINVDLMGTERLSLIPVGATTSAQMDASWPHPSFVGGFLPDERTITSHGFLATWQLSRFATGIEAAIKRRQSGVEQALDDRDFGVRFVQPVDVYQKSERAVKYGMLFVTLTFVAFLLFEVLKRLPVHPVQYTLAGAAVALFFLLLISLSEHIPFGAAYLAASSACVGLLGFYVSHVLGSVTRGVAFGGLISMLYGVLYVLLQSEDYALLLGSLLLFVLLAAIMIMTRRVDWYRLGEGKATSAAGRPSPSVPPRRRATNPRAPANMPRRMSLIRAHPKTVRSHLTAWSPYNGEPRRGSVAVAGWGAGRSVRLPAPGPRPRRCCRARRRRPCAPAPSSRALPASYRS